MNSLKPSGAPNQLDLFGITPRKPRRPSKPEPYRLSERITLKPGQLLRVTGGPIYISGETVHRLGHRGLVRFDRAIVSNGRPFLVVRTVESLGRKGTLLGRYETLYVGSEPYRNPLFPKILNRPYRVRRVRQK